MPTLPTACPLDCPDACSLSATVEDGRLVRLDGDHRNPLTAGFICAKVREIGGHVQGAERLRHPAIRVGAKGEGRFATVSWDEALDQVAARLREAVDQHGGESILPVCYGGSNGLLTQDATDARLFHRLGASRLAKTLCAAPSGRAYEGLYGRMPGVALPAYRHARLIVLWGVNPSATGIHSIPVIKRARSAGATLVVVDPRRTPLAQQADLHLAPRPGTDLCLALALIEHLFATGRADREFLSEHATGVEALRERASAWSLPRAAAEAGVPQPDLERFAALYSSTRPAVIRCGWGVERNRNGGSAVAAILALPAVAGCFGVPGGGFTMSNSRTIRLDGDAAAAAPAPSTREINLNRVGRALTEADPPIHVVLSYNCNPLSTLPDQERVRRGLLREDLFTVVFDQVMTDTARHADVLLPATTFLEHDDLTRGYGAMVVQRVRPVLPTEGEARPNWMVFEALCDRLGLSEPGDPRGPDAMVEAILGATEDARSIADAVRTEGVAQPPGGSEPVQMRDVWPRHADRRIHLCPEALDAEAPAGLYGYQPDPGGPSHPLALISPATRHTISSTFGQRLRQPAELVMHPQDASVRGIASGDEVAAFNELGRVECRARVSDEVRPGVVVLPKGLWSRHTSNGATANAVAPDALTDLGGGATFNDARVQVVRAT
ncbi:molybdopterin-containing oxidoreductase family protein [Paraliomyxa miuraensis]|uniref:molybdopterin-containing oxidoreductase family protein n=1 Tax=Paraliomyxa miuraensis TaxID=376150 RepID=UPI0022513DD5|nr:molybdopterin-dependent oxidoreductase [Paraliomyxa miuraensis]MCX4243819.1 molybdopterin-dependent oxidoreductase [Paraliomyxa miuraensis]